MHYEPIWRPNAILGEIAIPIRRRHGFQWWSETYRWFDIYPLLFADMGSYIVIAGSSPLFVFHFVIGMN